MRTNMKMVLCVLMILCWSTSSPLFAQFNSDFYFGAVRPTLQNQQMANEAANRTSVQPVGQAKQVLSGAKKEERHVEALLVSINDYDGAAGLTNLQGCNNDVRLMKDWLEKEGVFSDSVSVFSDDTTVSEQVPAYQSIQEELQRKSKLACDRLIVVFSCHGISAGGKSFICPVDVKSTDFADLEDRSDESVLNAGAQKNLLAFSTILSILKKSQAKEVLLILDACRNSQEEESFMREFTTLLDANDENFRKTNGGNFAVLTGCSSGQSAIEIYTKDGSAHGAFLYHFVDGLSGRADYAACYDGTVSLVEAYNYAYSRVSHEAQRRNRAQTPEIFMSSSNGNMTLASYAAPPATENETDIQFLMRVGIILADNRWKAKDNAIAGKALDCVLENVPNNALAYALRGSVRRKLGEYEGALADLEKIGEKFQLYAHVEGDSDDKSLPLRKSPDDKEVASNTGIQVKDRALLTIDAVDGDYFHISEINNEACGKKAGWVHRDNLTWSRVQANQTITATQMQQTVRTVQQSPSQSMISPGNIVGGGGGTFSSPGPVYH